MDPSPRPLWGGPRDGPRAPGGPQWRCSRCWLEEAPMERTFPSKAGAVVPREPLPRSGEVPPMSARGHVLYLAGDIVGCSRCGAYLATPARAQFFWECDPDAPHGNPQRKWRRDNFMKGVHPKGGKAPPLPTPRRLQVSDEAVQWLGLFARTTSVGGWGGLFPYSIPIRPPYG